MADICIYKHENTADPIWQQTNFPGLQNIKIELSRVPTIVTEFSQFLDEKR